jgi:hypothetical protein
MRDPCIGGAPQSNPMHRAQTCALTRSTLYGRGIDFAPRRAPATPGPDPFAPTGGLHGKNIHRKEPVAYLKRSIGIQDGATSARPLRCSTMILATFERLAMFVTNRTIVSKRSAFTVKRLGAGKS